jgi:uridine phosphorylase
MNLNREDWLKAIGLREDEVPETIILEGTWWHKERYKMRLAHLSEVRELKFPDMYWGRYQGKAVMFCCAYGAPRAVEPVHVFGSLGTKTVIQIGSCGALQVGVHTGDIILPERAVIGEGASQYYGGAGLSVATPELVETAQKMFESRDFTTHRGLHLTTSALFPQSKELIQKWLELGYLGVDMETSAVFSAARHFGMRCASFLFAWDELLRNRTWLDTSEVEEQEKQQAANKAIFEVALELL